MTNETESILHAEALRREAVGFAEYMMKYIAVNFSQSAAYIINSDPAKWLDLPAHYLDYKKSQK